MVTFVSCDTEQVNPTIKIKPFIQSDDSRCGPATLKMILNYYGYDVSEDTLAFAEKCFDAGDIKLLVNSLARIVKC